MLSTVVLRISDELSVRCNHFQPESSASDSYVKDNIHYTANSREQYMSSATHVKHNSGDAIVHANGVHTALCVPSSKSCQNTSSHAQKH
jgi:hypothetical protein